jgi:hypothetical protein
MYYTFTVERNEKVRGEAVPHTIGLVGIGSKINSLYQLACVERDTKNTAITKVSPIEAYPYELINHPHKIMIVGPGRSGTTFLVQMFTRLGFHTGFVPYNETLFRTTRAGGEFDIFSVGMNVSFNKILKEFEESPFILKAPIYSWYLKMLVFGCKVPIGHVIIPVRNHREVAESRIGEGIAWEFTASDIHSQILANDMLLGKAVEACVVTDTPMTFIRFPDLVKDADYCLQKMQNVCLSYGIQIDKDDFYEEFAKLADPTMIKYGKNYQNASA